MVNSDVSIIYTLKCGMAVQVIQGRLFWDLWKAHIRLLLVIHGNFGPVSQWPFLRYNVLLVENRHFLLLFYLTFLIQTLKLGPTVKISWF